jgi:hypothetical protein
MKSTNSNCGTVPGLVLSFGLVLAAAPVLAEGGIDADASRILQAMADHLGGLDAYSADADVDNEVIDLEGQKLQLSSDVELVVQRTDNLYVHRHGPFADVELFFDGKTMTIYGKDTNVFLQLEAPGNLEQGVEALRSVTGLDAPGADLVFADAYRALTEDATSGTYRGTAFVNGVECDYLTFRGNRADWQLWVRHGDRPLPMKYVITTKWLSGAPQYSVRFRNWNTEPSISAKQFAFVPPDGARAVETLTVGDAGELKMQGGAQ